MKILVQMKDPDALHDAIEDSVYANRGSVTGVSREEYDSIASHRIEAIDDECCRRWFRHGEYLAVEIDTDNWTIRVMENE